MHRLGIPIVALLAILGVAAPPARGQNGPSLVGVWEVKYTIVDTQQSVARELFFEAMPPEAGPQGRGTYVVTGLPFDPPTVPLPAAWDQITDQIVSFTGEIRFPIGNVGQETGTLTFKGTFRDPNTIQGGVVFVTNELDTRDALCTGYVTKIGTFTATRRVDSSTDLASCACRRDAAGRLRIEVTSDPARPFVVGQTTVLVNGQPCRRQKYPRRFRNGQVTTRIDCYGGIEEQLPATVSTVSNGIPSSNSLVCDRKQQ